MEILKYFHLTNTKPSLKPHLISRENKMEKIQEILDQILMNWKMNYKIGQNIVVDESICGFKGRISFKQYAPQKHKKQGIKVYCLADGQSGYIYDINIYHGKLSLGKAGDIVMNLVQSHKNKGHHLFLDNYFVTMDLLEKLKNDGFGVTATIRMNRTGLSKDLQKPNKKSLKPNSWKFYFWNDYLLLLWRDKRLVSCVSSVIGTTFEECSRYDKKEKKKITISKPSIVKIYSQFMHGVDRADQAISYYDFSRKSLKWWKKLFFYLLNITISNAYKNYLLKPKPSNKETLSSKKFRMNIIKFLLATNIKYQNFAEKKKFSAEISKMHLLEPIPDKKQRLCSWNDCSKRPIYQCKTCIKTICPEHFVVFHENL